MWGNSVPQSSSILLTSASQSRPGCALALYPHYTQNACRRGFEAPGCNKSTANRKRCGTMLGMLKRLVSSCLWVSVFLACSVLPSVAADKKNQSPCAKPREVSSKPPLSKQEQKKAHEIRAQGMVAISISEALSGHVKTGQRWSWQNRPTEMARD